MLFIEISLDIIALWLIMFILFQGKAPQKKKVLAWIVVLTIFCLFDQTSITVQPFEHIYVRDLAILPVQSIAGIMGFIFVVLLMNSFVFQKSHLEIVFITILGLITWVLIRLQMMTIVDIMQLSSFSKHVGTLILAVVFYYGMKRYLQQWILVEFSLSIKLILSSAFSLFIYIMLFTVIESPQLDPVIIMMIVVGSIVMFGWLFFEQRKSQIIESRMRAVEEYIPIIDELVMEVRARQHEFSNKMLAISSILQTATNLEEAKEEMEQYIENVKLGPSQQELLNMDHKVIAGFLYTKIKRAEQMKICIDVKRTVSVKDFPCEDFDFVEILGILLDNAIEASFGGEIIYVSMHQTGGRFELTVSNPADYRTNEQFMKMFELGFSTKANVSKERGYGLYNVQQLAKQYKANIIVRNEQREMNYITLGIQF